MRLPPSRALEAIQSGKLSAGYILLGQEIYWRDRLLAALRGAIGANDSTQAQMAVSEYDLRSDSFVRILDAAREPSLLAPRRLLIVRNAQNLSPQRARKGKSPSRRRGKAASSLPRSAKSPKLDEKPEGLSAYLRDPNPDSVLVLEMMDVNLDSDDWREREKVQRRLEAIGALCDVVLLTAPGFGDAMELVRQKAAACGCAISSDAAELLVTAFDRNMGRIRMEIEKLSVSRTKPPRSKALQIEVDDVTRLSTSLAFGSSQPLVEALGSADPGKALEALAEVERSGRYAPLVLLEVTRYLRQLILLREKKASNSRQASNTLWSARLPAPQGALPSLIDQARRIKGRSLLSALQAAYDAEIALRSGPPSDRIILERFVLQLLNLSRRSIPLTQSS